MRLQDILFGILGLVVATLLAFHFQVEVLALIGAFACGSIYLLAGMLPSRDESIWRRLFTTVFLAMVLSSLVLIVPGTFGSQAIRPAVETTVMTVAAVLPLMAIFFEVIRTPSVIRGILRCLGYR
jgi:hypothetical protein